MNSVIETVQKPLTERYWPWTCDDTKTQWGWKRVIGNGTTEVLSRHEAKKIQAFEDQPLLIAEILRLEQVIKRLESELIAQK